MQSGSKRSPRLGEILVDAVREHQAGRLREAASGYRRVLAARPHDPDALHLLGVIALAEGSARRAIALIKQAIAAKPAFAAAYSDLGNAQRALGDLDAAAASYREAIRLDPNGAPAPNNLGFLLCEKGDFSAALVHCRRATALAPNLAEAHNNLGNALVGLKQFAAAEAAFRRALALAPNAARWTNLGNLLTNLGRFDAAEQCYRRALVLDAAFAAAHHGLGTELRRRGELLAAVASFTTATNLNPRPPAVWNDLGHALRALGRFDDACAAFHRAIEIAPEFAEAYRNLSACGSLPVDGPEAARASALAARGDLPLDQRAAAGFALGKALDDAGRFDAAFVAYEAANRHYRAFLAANGARFDGAALRQEVDAIIATFGPTTFGTVARGDPSELPVFIVGMPRSGTSLVEQIAASHSQVFGAGELKNIGALACSLASAVAASDRARVQELAKRHLNCLRNLAPAAHRIIDKLPDNIFKLGEIATLFPGARVIFCRRAPRDLCLSCYFHKFSGSQLAFSYDLRDCATRFNETERLMAHWRRVLPLAKLDLCYEDLVADLEGESRRLITFLGLDWEASCLTFYRQSRVVATASAWQVRQPIYASSVGRWRHYAQHLGPLVEALRVPSSGDE